MNVFHCDHCRQLIFFENVSCVGCARTLAYLPDLGVVGSLDPAGAGLWRSPRAQGRAYRLCQNYTGQDVCNWAVPASDPNALCRSCRLTRVIPDLGWPRHKEAWYRLEVAKRRLVYSLLALRLPLASTFDEPGHGLAFEFLADPGWPAASVLTGHNNGVITVNLAEADDAERERRRVQMGEPYRTLLGHFRHEVGHYYWRCLIHGGGHHETAFRQVFGDERQDYSQALQTHYQQGPPPDWQLRFVSAYASVHPWEDWAETWAHYLHMTDALETAATCGLSLRPPRPGEPSLGAGPGRPLSFEGMVGDWFPLTYVLNNLNRGMGLPDAYPFILSAKAIDKLRFVHETVVAGAPEVPPRSAARRGHGATGP